MTRRTRVRLLIVLVLLGLPAMAALLALWYVGSGRLEQRLAHEYAELLPGELTVGKVEVDGVGRAHLDAVAVGPAGDAKVTAERVTVDGSLFGGRISALRIDGLHATIDRDAVAWIGDLARSLAARSGGGGAPADLEFTVSGAIDIAQAMPLDNLFIRGAVRGERVRARLTGTLAGEPIEWFVDHEDTAAGVRRIFEVRHAPIRLTPLFTALNRLTDLKEQADLLRWLPEVAELGGTRLVLEPGATAAVGPFVATWQGGEGGGLLTLSATGLRLDDARAEDRELGNARGTLQVAYQPTRLEVDVPAWSPGPRVPIPEEVPLRELFALLPAAHLVMLEEDDKSRVYLTLAPDTTLAGKRAVEVRWRKTSPWRIIANDLPLDLAKPWIPPNLALTGGRIDRLEVTIDDGLRFLEARLDGVALASEDWTLSELAPVLTVVPLADDPGTEEEPNFDATVVADAFMLRHRGDDRQGRVEIAIPDLDRLGSHVQGSRPTPTLAGSVGLDLTWRARADDGWDGELANLTARDVAVAGALVDVDLDARGAFGWSASARSVRLDGTLTAGELRVAGRAVPLASRSPRFTATVLDEAGHIVLSELLARAEGDHGFTVGLDGRINRASLDGELGIVVDRADLGWLSEQGELVPMPKKAKLAGEMSLSATARIADAAVQRVDGWLLPLGTELDLNNGEIVISGIKGAIAFRLAPAETTTNDKED
ncbi:MAG TPA: hypothetical protein VEL07_15155 [Planctomycetota bacterium]|nr:hypothetical protein [Planctomycetota bacterium]